MNDVDQGGLEGAHRAIDIWAVDLMVESNQPSEDFFADLQPGSLLYVPAFWITVQGGGNNGYALLGSTTKAGRLSASPTAMWMFTDGKSQTPQTYPSHGRTGSEDHQWVVAHATVAIPRPSRNRKPRTQAILQSMGFQSIHACSESILQLSDSK